MTEYLRSLGGDRLITLGGGGLLVGPTITPIPTIGGFVRGARWSWALGDTPAGSGPRRELTTATGRTVTWRLDATDTAQFSIDGAGDEISNWTRLATDLFVHREGELLHRGRVGPELGTIQASGHQVQLTSVGYRGWLDTHFIGSPAPVYLATAQGAIAWDLINTTQLRLNGNLGITDGIGTGAGFPRDRTDYVPGKPIGEAVSELGRVDNGFEWEIDADLALNRWYPRRGTDNGVVLDYPGRIVQVAYTFDQGTFANVAMATGDQTTTPVAVTAGGIATDPRGRIERAVGYPSVSDQATVAAKAAYDLTQKSVIKLAYRVTLRPGTWGGPADVWLGDTVHLAIKSGRVFEDQTPQRVVEITASPGNDGTETIQMLLAAP